MVYSPGDACKRCQTPLEVSRSIFLRDEVSSFVTVLGASGAGKTVYLGLLLDMLSRGHGNLTGVPNGAFSVAVQQHTVAALEHRRFPEKTPNEADQWNWVHCETRDSRKPKTCVDLITPDLAGEAIAMEVENPGSNFTVASCLRSAGGIILLLDSQRVRDHGRGEDMFGIKVLTYLANIHQERRQPAKNKKQPPLFEIPLAIVFTKSDNCPEATESPREFIATNMPGTTQICRQKFARRSLFAASVVGSTMTTYDPTGASVEIPLHVQPHGIVEPFQWVMNSLNEK